MSEFTIDGKKLKATDDVDGEVWLKGADVVEILKSTKRDSEELQEWISEQVLPHIEKSNDTYIDTSDEVTKLQEELERKNEEIVQNHRTITKLRKSLAELQKQLYQLESKVRQTENPDETKANMFFLIKKNLKKIESDMDYFQYYALRTRKRFAREGLEHIKSKYPEGEVIYQVEDPPEVDLFNRLTELKNVRSCENHLETKLTDEELISLFKELKVAKKS